MFNIPNASGPIDYGEEPGQAGDSSAATKKSGQELIARANAVPIAQLFKLYNVRADAHNRKVTCPFKFHSNGQERTPSFWYYPDTNSFNCFGCSHGGGPVQFVMHMDNSDHVGAAVKILELFEADIDEDLIFEGRNSAERVEIMAEFSNAILEFRQNHASKHAFEFIEYVCWVYDRMNLIHEHDNDALRGLNLRLIDWIQAYQPDLRLSFEDKYLKTTCKL